MAAALHRKNTLKLYLARHGETDLNAGERFQGVSDLPLNARGHAQAARLAHALPTGIEFIATSPQLRARQTAEAVANARHLPLQSFAEFRERDFGCFEGLNPDEAAQRYPDLWARKLAYQWADAPPGGESAEEVVRRVVAGLLRLHVRHAGRPVLLVAHGFVVRAVRFIASGITKEEFFVLPRIDNGNFLEMSPLTTAQLTRHLNDLSPAEPERRTRR